MNEILPGIGIFLLGVLATVGIIWIIQVITTRQKPKSTNPIQVQVTPEEFILEHLSSQPPDPPSDQIQKIKKDLKKRYRLSKSEADELLTNAIRSSAFERVTGARCTCYAESKQYGKYFHAPSCEYRKFLEERQ
jgi:hypothetical protein